MCNVIIVLTRTWLTLIPTTLLSQFQLLEYTPSSIMWYLYRYISYVLMVIIAIL